MNYFVRNDEQIQIVGKNTDSKRKCLVEITQELGFSEKNYNCQSKQFWIKIKRILQKMIKVRKHLKNEISEDVWADVSWLFLQAMIHYDCLGERCRLGFGKGVGLGTESYNMFVFVFYFK